MAHPDTDTDIDPRIMTLAWKLADGDITRIRVNGDGSVTITN